MPTLETIALNSSNWLWNELQDALTQRVVLHEIGCTDFFLKRLQKEAGARVIVKTITDEVNIGADWEWWFMTKSGTALPVRVQAKVMFMDFNVLTDWAANPQFKHLHYKPTRATHTQTETLIHRAILDGMFPLYCLYTTFNDTFVTRNPACSCKYYGMGKSAFGVSLVGAETVHVRPSKHLHAYLDELHAFPCFFNSLYSLRGLMRYLQTRWPYTNAILQTGAYRNGQSALPDSGTFTGSLIRPLSETPAYVQDLFQLALHQLEEQDEGSTLNVESEEGEFDKEEALTLLPEGTGRITLFLLGHLEEYDC